MLVASDPVTATNAANRDYAQPVYAALDGSFTEASSGFAGSASDGLAAARRDAHARPDYTDAVDGNVVQTARVALGGNGKTVLALGFGASQARGRGHGRGLAATRASTSRSRDYKKGWKQYDNSLTKPRTEKLAGIKGARRASSSRTSTT